MNRALNILTHLQPNIPQSNDVTAFKCSLDNLRTTQDDVVIVSALRTPICKAKRGGFKDTVPEDLLTAAITGVLNDVHLDPTLVQDICVGNVLQPGAGAITARQAQFYSGIPETVPIMAVNRQCSSGLQACMSIAGSIASGQIDIGIGAGVESQSMYPLTAPERMSERFYDNQEAQDSLIPMGITSENVATEFGIIREKQDQLAMESHAKATRAQNSGWFDAEIIPVNTSIINKAGNTESVTISQDDGVRPGTNLQALSKLKAAFQEDGSTTAGNSSQVSDGASAVILVRRSKVIQLGFPILGVVRAYSVVGVPPRVMGIGPAYAIPAVLKKVGLTIDDIDVFEINEAFASQAVYCVERLGIPREKLNPKGGAIALGHPLGNTGSRMIATLLHELKRRGKRAYGVVSMCMGGGMGAAAVLEYPGSNLQ